MRSRIPSALQRWLQETSLPFMPEATYASATAGLKDWIQLGFSSGRLTYQGLQRMWRTVRPPAHARLRVRKGMPLTVLFQKLNERHIDYIVMRWFERLPTIPDGSDLDILVSDADAPRLAKMLTRSSAFGGVPCDVYSVHGSGGYGYRGGSYYTPEIADGILERAQQHPSGARIPCPEDHFLGLAFHALYDKGYDSGLPVNPSEGPRKLSLKHDYTSVLRALAQNIHLDVSIDLHSLDRELGARGWRPPLHTLVTYGANNPWCRDLLAAK